MHAASVWKNMFVHTHKKQQWASIHLHHETCLAPPPPIDTPSPPRHSCRERSNDVCPSETWWIVMNPACGSIRERERGGGGKEGCVGGQEEEEEEDKLWVKTGLLSSHWCSGEKHRGDWQEMRSYASSSPSPSTPSPRGTLRSGRCD